MFNRTDIHTHFPWLAQRERRMIIGNDIDALLSAQFLQHTLGWSIAGFYNYTTLYVDPAIDPRDCVWVDLDIHDPACCSIGHHILRPTPTDRIPGHRSSVNPNLLRGIDQTDFTHKYPLGTIHFLLWLHDVRVRNKRACTLLLWLADSTWINAQRYRANVREWLTNWITVPGTAGYLRANGHLGLRGGDASAGVEQIAVSRVGAGQRAECLAAFGAGRASMRVG